MSVLDVGCGTGAISAGIAREVGDQGIVVGVDRDETLLEIARKEHQSLPNLRFEKQDARSLQFEACFDVVTTARMLQWISRADQAVAAMKGAVKPNGLLVALDYNHEENSWTPRPPIEFLRFYDAFLAWRHANEWDNRMADHLPALFQSAGLADVQVFVDDQKANRGDPGFSDAAALWVQVIQSVGPQIVNDGFLGEHERVAAETCYRPWSESDLDEQVLSMRTVVGTVL
jgi:SAM-dependent methyltransferase